MTDFNVSLRLTADGKAVVTESRRAGKAVEKLGSDTEKSGRAAGRAARQVDRFGRQAGQAGRRARKASSDTGALARELGSLKTAIGGVALGLLVREGVRTADTMTLMRGRMQLVAREGQNVNDIMDDLFDRAQNARTELNTLNRVFFRTARALNQHADLAGRAADVTELLAKSARISGASVTEMNAGLIQLSQGLASGELRGEELRSVLENIPDVARRIAAGLNRSIGELRDLAETGGTTTEVITRALLSQGDEIEREFAELPRTVGDALTQLKNEFVLIVDSQNRITGTTGELVAAIDSLKESAGETAPVIGGVAVALAKSAAFASENLDLIASLGAGYLAARSSIIIARGALAAFNAVAAASPIGLAAIAIGTLTTAVLAYESPSERIIDLQERQRESTRRLKEITDEAAAASEQRARSLDKERKELTEKSLADVLAELDAAEQAVQAARKRLTQVQISNASNPSVRTGGVPAGEVKDAEKRLAKAEERFRTVNELFNKLKSEANEAAAAVNRVLGAGDDGDSDNEDKQRFERSAEAAEKFAAALAAVEQSLDPAAKRAADFAKAQSTLDAAFLAGNLSAQRHLELTRKLVEKIYPSADAFVREFADGLAAERAALNLSEIALQAQRIAQEAINEAKAAGIDLSEENIAAIQREARAHAVAQQAASDRAAAERAAAEEIAAIRREALEQLQNETADAFKSLLDGELDTVADFFDAVVDIARRRLAEIATFEILASGDVLGGGLFGRPFGQRPANDNDPPDVTVPGLNEVISGLSKTLDDIGVDLGFASRGERQALDEGGGLGGLDADKIGKTLSQTIGDTIDGAVQGAALAQLGGLFGAKTSTTGGAIGGAIGQALPIPGGQLIGSLIGSIVGGLFKKSPRAQVLLTGGGDRNIFTRGKGEADTASALRGAVLSALSQIAKIGGGSVTAKPFGTIGQRKDEFFFDPRTDITNPKKLGDPKRFRFASAEGATLAALKEAIRDGVITGLSENVRTIARNSEAATPDAFLDDIAFARTFDALSKIGQATSRFVDEILELNAQFADAIERAADLGLAEEELAAARVRALDQIAEDFNRETELAILDMTDPVRAALERQADEARQFLLDAAAAGADIDEARRLVRLERDALIDELANGQDRINTAFRNGIDSLLEEIRFGDRSRLAPQDRLPVLLERFRDLAAAAPDDAAARKALDAAARDLLDTAEQVFASSAAFFDLQDDVAQSLKQLRDAGIATDDVEAIAREVGKVEQDPELLRQMDEIGTVIADSNQQVVGVLEQIRDRLPESGSSPAPGSGGRFGGGFGGSFGFRGGTLRKLAVA